MMNLVHWIVLFRESPNSRILAQYIPALPSKILTLNMSVIFRVSQK